jgi:methylenetetrahydrofolate dehydrogenase (NADP+)/methenyltetrahydrofolate cyclohydrolase
VRALQRKHGVTPCLAIIRVGEHAPSQTYVTSKRRQCEEVGILSFEYHLPSHIESRALAHLLCTLNQDSSIHGILIQLPLPAHLDSKKLLLDLDPRKDVDGLHPFNLGRLAMGVPTFIPCTPLGCLALIKSRLTSLKGQRVVIVGRSNLVGKPLGLLLLNQDCTVTWVHSQTSQPEIIAAQADILVAAVGQPKLITKAWVKPGAIVIDVGINYVLDSKGETSLVGDVDFEDVKDVAQAISPVPGGVGPMTVAFLLSNTLKAAQEQAV